MDKYSSCWLKQSIFFRANIWGNPENILMKSIIGMHNISLVQIPRIGGLRLDVTNFKK
jgi:hypothetical protein